MAEPVTGSVPVGAQVRVRAAASSANLGPGFDSFGLALGLRDDVRVRVTEGSATQVEVTGEGSGEVARDEDHLVVRALRRALLAAGVEQPIGLHLVCHNEIPHGRGLGSSAAAVVAGLAAGRALAGLATGDHLLGADHLLSLATDLEGHPDNAAAALLGGLTISWAEVDGPRAVRVGPHPDIDALVLVPDVRLATARARSLLPGQVGHGDAAANAARAALLVLALTRHPDLLLPATEDRLHQRQRTAGMPPTLRLVDRLRDRGLAAVVSGAGPSVLVLTTRSAVAAVRDQAAAVAGEGWRSILPGIAAGGPEVSAQLLRPG
jgi:homoserine kinase